MTQADIIQEKISLKEKIRDIKDLEMRLSIQCVHIDNQIDLLIDEQLRLKEQISAYRHQWLALGDRVFDLEELERY